MLASADAEAVATAPELTPAAPAWLARLAYDGTGYNGWQKQPELPTIQGALEQRLGRLFRAGGVRTLACSRTDTGVHALDQQVHITLPPMPVIPIERAQRALNRALPPDLRILSLAPVSASLDIRVLARAKAYTYCFHQGVCRSPFIWRFCWAEDWRLEVDLMRQAAQGFLGTHDCSRLGVRLGETPDRDPIKTMYAVWIRQHDEMVSFTVLGSGFLYRMVRRMASLLAGIGSGRLPADAVRTILAGGGQDLLYDTAPPNGLCLERVFLAGEAWREWQPGPLCFQALLGTTPLPPRPVPVWPLSSKPGDLLT